MHRTLFGYARHPGLSCSDQGIQEEGRLSPHLTHRWAPMGSWKFPAESSSPSSTEGQSSERAPCGCEPHLSGILVWICRLKSLQRPVLPIFRSSFLSLSPTQEGTKRARWRPSAPSGELPQVLCHSNVYSQTSLSLPSLSLPSPPLPGPLT